MLDPAAVVIGGGVAGLGDLWWQALRDAVRRETLPSLVDVPVLASTLGSDAPLLGAAVTRLGGHRMNKLIAQLRHRLVVSCQAYPGEPMRTPDTMRRVALAAAQGGAAGIRAQGLADIAAIRQAVDLPLIGLWKDGDDDVFITPTLEHALAVAGPARTSSPSTAPRGPGPTAEPSATPSPPSTS